MDKEQIIKDMEIQIMKTPCSEILEEEDWKDKTMDDLPEILGKRLVPYALRSGFNAGVQFEKRSKKERKR